MFDEGFSKASPSTVLKSARNVIEIALFGVKREFSIFASPIATV